MPRFRIGKEFLFFAIPLFLSAIALFAWKPFVTSLIEWKVQKYCHDCFGGDFKAKSLSWEDGSLKIVNPIILSDTPVEKGGHCLVADRMTVNYDFSLWNKTIHLFIHLENPQCTFGDNPYEWIKAAAEQSQDDSYFTIVTNISVPQGSFVYSKDKKISFSLDLVQRDTINGNISAHFLHKDDQYNQLGITMHDGESDCRTIDLQFQNLDIAECVHVLQLFDPSLQQIKVFSGKANGYVKICQEEAIKAEKKARPFLDGKLVISDILFEHQGWGLTGEIPEVILDLAESGGENSQSRSGKIVINKNSSFTLAHEGFSSISLTNFAGGIYLKNREKIKVGFEGTCSHHGQTFHASLDGEALYPLREFASFDINMLLQAPDTEDIGIRFLGRGLEKGLCLGQLDIKNFRKEEFDILKACLGSHAKDLEFVQVHQGCLDASLIGYVKNRKIDELNIEKISVRNLQFDIASWELNATIPEAAGTMKINLDSRDIFDTLDAEIAISNGIMLLGSHDKERWQFENIHTQLAVQKGVLKKSVVKAEFAGLKGMMEMDWSNPEEVMQVHFEGETGDLARWMPQAISQGMKKKFAHDKVAVNAAVKKNASGVNVKSLIDIHDSGNSIHHYIKAGFDLSKTSECLWKQWPPNPIACTYCNQLAFEIMKTILPASAMPINFFQTEWLKQKSGWLGMTLDNGWFEAENLPLGKFVEPFVFWNDQFVLAGTGDFKGKFDLNGLLVEYQGRNMSLDNDNLSIEFSSPSAQASKDGPLLASGSHYFDFSRGANFGTLNVADGCYFEKNSGLFFADISTEIIIEGMKIHAKNIETYCHDVYFTGAIDVDYSYPEPGFFDVDVYTKSINGKASALREVISHFARKSDYGSKDCVDLSSSTAESRMIADIPLEGNVTLLEPGGYLRFVFDPDDFQLQAKVVGRLSDGTLEILKEGIAIQDLGLNFDYDHGAKTLDLRDIQGAVYVGKGEQIEEYALEGSSIKFGDMDRCQADFDFSIGGKPHELLRLAGHTRVKARSSQEGVLQFIFDKERTHLLGAHPGILELVLREGKEVENFHLELGFELGDMFDNIKRLGRTGMLFNLALLQNGLANLEKPRGTFHVDLRYDQKNAQFTYNLKGSDISLGQQQFHKCLLVGKKKGSTWSIEQLQLDRLSLAADIAKEEHRWVFDFLGVRWGDSLLAGMDGEYIFDQGLFTGRVNLFELDFESLHELSFLRAFAEKYQPKGDLKASGTLRFEFTSQDPGWKLDSLLNISLSSFEMMGVRFQDTENASCHLVSNERITFRQLVSAFKSSQDDSIQGLANMDKVEYDFTTEAVILDGVHFNIPAEHLDWVADNLQRCYPDEVNDSVADAIRKSKRNGNLKGSVALHAKPDGNELKIQLIEGKYWWLDREHDVNNFLLEQNRDGVNIVLQYQFQQHPFWVYCRSDTNDLKRGQMVISDQLSGKSANPPPNETLALDWVDDPQYGFMVQMASGSFAGLRVNLVQDPDQHPSKNFLHFIGDMSVDIRKASSLVSAEFRDSLAGWEFGKGYVLNGKWQFNKHSLANRADYLSFQGQLLGQDVEFKGYQFEKLQAQINYAFGKIRLNDLIVEDPAGGLHIDAIAMDSDEDGENWMMSAGKAALRDFRPSLLREAGGPPQEYARPLVIRELEINGLHGMLGDAATFIGSGSLTFQNKSKRVLQHPLFAIPTEILNRIGLDLAVLNPVSGSIIFTIRDGRVYLSKFKDMYSDGKLSKFYLSSNSKPSSVDFYGNLDLHVRMKQYNLLFKIAELFTVSVKGNIQKPIYSLQKQERKDKSETVSR